MTTQVTQDVPRSQSDARTRPASGVASLRLEGVTRRYADKVALDAISLTLPDNEYVSLLGPSGSGKTVLLRVIAGFEAPDAGQITLGGARIDTVPAHRRGIGFVFQNFALFPHLSVFDNVAFGLAHGAGAADIDEPTRRAQVADMIALVGLNGLERRGVHEISGGQRQRVALARTMVTRPRLVLLDEPLGALDANLRARMRAELHNIRERLGVTFLHVTGSESEALAMGDRVVVLDRGRVSQFDVPDVIYSRPANPDVARFLNCYNLFTGTRGENGFACAQALFPVPPSALHVANPHGGQSQSQSQSRSQSQSQPQPMAHQAQSTYAIRQDLVRFSSPDDALPEAHASLLARFVTSEYSGPTIRYFFKAEAGQIVEIDSHLSHQKPADLDPGRAYRLFWAANDAVVFA